MLEETDPAYYELFNNMFHRLLENDSYFKKCIESIVLSVVDNLLSTSESLPLSANQGRILNEKIETRTGTSRGILAAGETSITIYDKRIFEGCAIQPFTSVDGVNPTSKSVEVGSVTYTFDEQDEDIEVGVLVYV